jgi:hypothetical protein
VDRARHRLPLSSLTVDEPMMTEHSADTSHRA